MGAPGLDSETWDAKSPHTKSCGQRPRAFPDFLWPKQEAGSSTTSLRCKDFAQDDTFFRSTVFGEDDYPVSSGMASGAPSSRRFCRRVGDRARQRTTAFRPEAQGTIKENGSRSRANTPPCRIKPRRGWGTRRCKDFAQDDTFFRSTVFGELL